MDSKIIVTAHITVTKSQEEVKDRYGNVEVPRDVRQLVELDVNSDSVEDAQTKIQALLEIYK